MNKQLEKLEEIIGYTFKNKQLLTQALTHSSYANEKKQLQRLMKRDHIDEVYAKAIIANQISSSIKKDKADIVLDNNGNTDELYKQIKKMMKGIENESIVNE